MNKLISFAFDSKDIRVIVDDVTKPLFVARDVATLLGYKKPENAVRAHCKKSSTCSLVSGGQVRNMLVIPEADVWRLVMRSELPEAETFQDWVCETVLPEIRQNGGYVVGQESLPEELQEAQRENLKTMQRFNGLYMTLIGSGFIPKAKLDAIRETIQKAAKVAQTLDEDEATALARSSEMLVDAGLSEFIKRQPMVGSMIATKRGLIDFSKIPNRYIKRHSS